MSDYLILTKGSEFLRVPIDALMYIKGDGNYSNIVTLNGDVHTITLQLGAIEDKIGKDFEDSPLVRCGRSLIVNINYVYLIDDAKQRIIISDCRGKSHSLEASKKVLAGFKTYMLNL